MPVRISIVTICFNNLEDLKLTCAHIDRQTVQPYEHIIINGSTTPDIQNWLQENEQPHYRHAIHERDQGISDAFNKGINSSTGDVVHLQNAGDYYFDENVLKLVSEAFEKDPKLQWLHGKYVQHRGGMWLTTGKPFDRALLYRGMRTIGHPTMFLKHSLYEKYGLFDLDKKIAMDYDLLVRIADEPFLFIDKPMVYFTPGGVSDKKIRQGLKEVQDSYRRYRGNSIKLLLWGLRIEWLRKFTDTKLGNRIFHLKNKSKALEN